MHLSRLFVPGLIQDSVVPLYPVTAVAWPSAIISSNIINTGLFLITNIDASFHWKVASINHFRLDSGVGLSPPLCPSPSLAMCWVSKHTCFDHHSIRGSTDSHKVKPHYQLRALSSGSQAHGTAAARWCKNALKGPFVSSLKQAT